MSIGSVRWTVEQLENHQKRCPESRVAYVPKDIKKVEKDSEATVSLTKKPEGNKKVRNAIKIEHDGVKYDSKLEFYTASELKKHGISYEFQKCYLLQEGFTYQRSKIRPMTLTVDFWLPQFDLIIDSKGFRNDVSPVKYKLLKFSLKSQGQEPDIEMPKNKREVDSLILFLIGRKNAL